MLTGELPGKRIEPPSKKVQIDVRLDEVVLRALEKSPERRYQQASLLKTQVETIGASSAGAPASIAAAPGQVQSPTRFALWLFLLAYAGLMIFLFRSSQLLPPRMASHFGADGRAYGWMDRTSYLVFIAALPLLFAGFAWLVQVVPARFFNIPRRDYWLAPERRPALVAFLRERMLWLGCVIIGLVAALHGLTISANRLEPAQLPMGPFVMILIGFLVAVMIWLASLVMRLADINRPLDPPSGPRSATGKIALGLVLALAGALELLLLASAFSTPRSPAALADNPGALRKASTAKVIEAGLAKPLNPWAWQALEECPLTTGEVARVTTGITDWLRATHPPGLLSRCPGWIRF